MSADYQPLAAHGDNEVQGERSSMSLTSAANYGSNTMSEGSFPPSHAMNPPLYNDGPYQPPLFAPSQVQAQFQNPPQSQIVQYPAAPSFAPPSIVVNPAPVIIVKDAVLIGNRLILPPPPYVPPINPMDPSLTSVISETDPALLSDERIFRSLPHLTKQQLHNFCIAHSEVPRMVIHVEGYHETTTSSRDHKGNVTTTTIRTTDWEFSANPTPWIAGPGRQLGVEEAVSRFVESTSNLKTITITKVVKWDLPQFIQLVRALAREKGYQHNVVVSMRFEKGCEKCVVEASNSFNDCVNSTPCKVLCFISCLCLLWAPIKYCSTDDFHIRDEFVMTLEPAEYLTSIQHLIPAYASSGCQIM